MLQEPVDKFKRRHSGCFPLIGVAVFKAEAHLIVFELFYAVVGDGNSVDIRRQVFLYLEIYRTLTMGCQ